MSDRRRRGEDEFASESPWPDDNPNDYRWAQDLAREAREEAQAEERRGRHSSAHETPGDPYGQPPSSQPPHGSVPPPAQRAPTPRTPVDPRTGHPSGPMPTVPAETYNRGARPGGPPVDPRTGHPSGPMPAVPPGNYDRGARRAGPPVDPRTGHPSGPMPAVPPETYDHGARRGGPPVDPRTGHPSGPMPTVPADAYDRDTRRAGPPAGWPARDPQQRGQAGTSGPAGPGDPYAAPDPYQAPRDRPSRQDAPRGRSGRDPLSQGRGARGRPAPVPAPAGQDEDGWERNSEGRYVWAPGAQPTDQRRGGQDDYAGPAGRRGEPGRGPRDGYDDAAGRYGAGPVPGAGGGYDDAAGQRGGGSARFARGSRQGRAARAGAGYGDAPGQYGGGSARPGQGRATGPGGGHDDAAGQYGSGPARPGRTPADGYDDGAGHYGARAGRAAPGRADGYDDAAGQYRDDAAGGSGFFDGLRANEPGGPGRGRGRRRGGDDGGWDDGRGRTRKGRGGRVGGLAAIIVLLIIGTPLIVGGYFLYSAYEAHYNPPNYSGDGTGVVTFQVLPGDTAFSVANRLVTDGIVASARALELAAESSKNASGLQPGFYRLHKHMSAAAAWALLLAPSSRVQLTVTIPEGLRISQLLPLLSKDSGISLSAYRAALRNPAALGLPAYANNDPEGYLYPATYQIQPNATATSVLKQMVAAYNNEAVSASLTQAARAVGLTPAQVIVVASLAQAEAGKNSDMPKIARVVYNRLHINMALDFDSTVLFALNTYGIAATNQQLQVNSPYNTYTHKGLPPGPIDSPGNVAIQAALHPATGSWLYFVDVNPKLKDTVFTSSATVFQQLENELRQNTGG